MEDKKTIEVKMQFKQLFPGLFAFIDWAGNYQF
jgi:hypothetical protein